MSLQYEGWSMVESITERFWLLARYPYMGRRREEWHPGLRSFTADDYVIIHRIVEDEVVLIFACRARHP